MNYLTQRRMVRYSKFLCITLAILFLTNACNQSDFQETESGLQYKIVREGNGKRPQNGEFILMNVAYFDANDNKIFSSADRGGAQPMSYIDSLMSKNGSIEECFTLVKEGDSAIFKIKAEDLFLKSYNLPIPDTIDAESRISLFLGIEKVFTLKEFDAYRNEQIQIAQKKQMESQREQIREDLIVIDSFLKENNLSADTTLEGLRIVAIKEGTGQYPKSGQQIKVNYTGSLLNGEVFDTSDADIAKANNMFTQGRRYEPYAFTLGQGAVIRGWDIGLGKLKEGGKATIFIPSSLAYGIRGSGRIKPNAILKFNVELVEIIQ